MSVKTAPKLDELFGTNTLAFCETTIRHRSVIPLAPVVRAATLAIASGEALALVGESGSGKSTLAYASMADRSGGEIIGGSIKVSGADVSTLSGSQLH